MCRSIWSYVIEGTSCRIPQSAVELGVALINFRDQNGKEILYEGVGAGYVAREFRNRSRNLDFDIFTISTLSGTSWAFSNKGEAYCDRETIEELPLFGIIFPGMEDWLFSSKESLWLAFLLTRITSLLIPDRQCSMVIS
ncbi:hypothetical protein HWI79_634 [Cryptosporidium felis]|nr:hypothetical protein HWI79_634 [Cryptosporidium felis]